MHFVRCVMRVDHLLPNLLSQRQEVLADLIEAGGHVAVVFLWCRDGGCWCGRIHGVWGYPHPLCHLPHLVDAALGETQPNRAEVEHPNVGVLVISVLIRRCCSSLRRLAAARGCLAVSRRLRLPVLRGREEPKDSRGSVGGRLLPIPRDRAPARWAY